MARIVLKDLESDRSLTVSDLEALIGRDPACGFRIDGPKSKVVSARHARIFFQDGAWWIQDISRNGTILDDERLQGGHRHALRVGQLIGLGDSGPRLRVAALESRADSGTLVEAGELRTGPHTTAPRPRPMGAGVPTGVNVGDGTSAMRKSEALRAGLRIEEPTEPAQLSGAWHLVVTMRAAHADQRFEGRASVVKLGRSPECAIRIPPEQGASVSRVHAEIAVGDSGVVVRDAGSRNGTFLNGARIESAQPLAIGDRLMLGSGGPTLQVEDLHIIKGEGPRGLAAPNIGGSITPAEAAQRSGARPLSEPLTAPSDGFGSNGAAGANPSAATRVPSPPRGAAIQQGPPPAPARTPGPRLALYVMLGIAVVALAVLVGRLTAP